MSTPPKTTPQPELNPYKAPAIPSDHRNAWVNPRLHQALNVFAIAFAPVPLGMRIIEEAFGLTIDGFMRSTPPDLVRPVALMFVISILLACLLWLISLVINIRGAFKLRVMPMIGVLLNVISLVAMF